MKSMKNEKAVTPVLAVILLVAITVIVAVIIAVFMFGVGAPADAPQAKLRFVADDMNITIYHEGGDPLIGKDSKVIVTDAVNPEYGPYYIAPCTDTNGDDTLDQILTTAGSSTPDTFVPGESIEAGWTSGSEPESGAIIIMQVMDIPTGQMVANVKVVVN